MTGNPAELGIIPCAVDGVFDAITADTDRAFLLRVSYIEIYNETLRDLLNFKKGTKDVPAIHTNKVSSPLPASPCQDLPDTTIADGYRARST